MKSMFIKQSDLPTIGLEAIHRFTTRSYMTPNPGSSTKKLLYEIKLV